MSRPPIDPCSPVARAMAASHEIDQRRLRAAAEALQAATPWHGVLFDRTMRRKGHAPVQVLFRWPGVLMALDPIGGGIIREAVAGDMGADMPLAAAFVARQAKGRSLKTATFQPPQSRRLRASIGADGVVRVHAIKGGELLAESEPGQPLVLRAGFHSLSPADLAPRAT